MTYAEERFPNHVMDRIEADSRGPNKQRSRIPTCSHRFSIDYSFFQKDDDDKKESTFKVADDVADEESEINGVCRISDPRTSCDIEVLIELALEEIRTRALPDVVFLELDEEAFMMFLRIRDELADEKPLLVSFPAKNVSQFPQQQQLRRSA